MEFRIICSTSLGRICFGGRDIGNEDDRKLSTFSILSGHKILLCGWKVAVKCWQYKLAFS